MTSTPPTAIGPTDPELLCLPKGYRQRGENLSRDGNDGPGDFWAPWRVEHNLRFQHHVYAWAARIARDARAASIVDVGCGPGLKLVKHMSPLGASMTGVDQASAIELAHRLSPGPRYVVADLESGHAELGGPFDVVLCADVLEHLVNPLAVLELISGVCSETTQVILSTPERDRERGRGCLVSEKPEHVREWARDEFVRFVERSGFRVRRSRLFPKADQDPRDTRLEEAAFRAGHSDRSPWACHALLCTRML